MKYTAEKGMVFRHKETKKLVGRTIEILDNDSIENYEQVRSLPSIEEIRERFNSLKNRKK